MIKLFDGCWINPEDVSEVTANYDSLRITVRMRGGVGHGVEADYGISLSQTMGRLITVINAARTGSKETT